MANRKESVEKALHGAVESVLSRFRKRTYSSGSDEEETDLRPLRKTRYLAI